MFNNFQRLVKRIERAMKNKNTTNSGVLSRYGKYLLGSQFGGVYAEDSKVSFHNPNKKFYIFNTDKHNEEGSHWLAVYADHPDNEVYVFDTFNRQTSKLVPDTSESIRKQHMKVVKGTSRLLQHNKQKDCGQRSLAILLLIKKYGIERVEKEL